MSATTSVIKTTAKTALKGNWFKSAVVSIVFLFYCIIDFYLRTVLVSFIGNFFGYIYFLLSVVFMGFPLILGIIRFFWRMMNSVVDEPIAIFYYFSSMQIYRKAIKTAFIVIGRIILFAVLALIPAVVTSVLSSPGLYNFFNIPMPIFTANLTLISTILKAFGFAAIFFCICRYFPVLFLINADEEMDVSEAVHISSLLFKSNYSDAIYLIFSFAGWIILSILLFPLIFTLPYMIVSLLVHSRFSVAQYNKNIKKENSFILR